MQHWLPHRVSATPKTRRLQSKRARLPARFGRINRRKPRRRIRRLDVRLISPRPSRRTMAPSRSTSRFQCLATKPYLHRSKVRHHPPDYQRCYTYDGARLREALIDMENTASEIWADTAYHSAATEAYLDKCGRRTRIDHKKPKVRPMPELL
jgi:hypothetical protein